MKNARTGIFALFMAATIAIMFSCCKDKTDTQPPQIEVIPVESKVPDTLLVVVSDTITGEKDSFITSEKPQPLLNEVKEIKEEIKEVDIRYVPLDSLVDAIYMSQVGVREATGNNDGKDVEKYLRSVGISKGNAWCAAFVKWCFDQAGVKTTITAWSPTAHNSKNLVLDKSVIKKEVQRGDVFTIYFPKLKRIGHTGFVQKRFGVNSYQTVEGNTNSAGSREGDGVYVKIRPKSSLYSITRWL